MRIFGGVVLVLVVVGCKPRLDSDLAGIPVGTSGSLIRDSVDANMKIQAYRAQIQKEGVTGFDDPNLVGLREIIKMAPLENLVEETPANGKIESRVGDFAAQELIRSLNETNVEGGRTEAQTLLVDHFSYCLTYDSCMRKIASLSMLAPFMFHSSPSSMVVLGQLAESIPKSTVRQKFLIDIIQTKIRFLRTVVAIYASLGLDSNPEAYFKVFMTPADVATYRTQLKDLGDDMRSELFVYSQVYPEDKEAIKKFYKAVASGLSQHYKYLDPRYQGDRDHWLELARTQYVALKETANGVEALLIYLDRLEHRSAEVWLRRAATIEDASKAEVYLKVLEQFSKWEVPYADGSQWLTVAKSLQERFFKDNETHGALVQGMADRRNFERSIQDSFIKNDAVTNAEFIRKNEAKIASLFPAFNSFHYHMSRIMLAEIGLNDVIKGFKNPKSPTNEEGVKLQNAVWTIDEMRLGLLCFGYFFRYGTGIDSEAAKGLVQRGEFFVSSKKQSYHPEDICFYGKNRAEKNFFYDQLKLGNVTAQQASNRWTAQQQIDDIWAPVKFEIYLTLATLPFTIVSGGASTAAGAGVAKVLGQVALKEALKQAGKQALIRWGAKAALQFSVEVVAFAAVNRALMAAAAQDYANYTNDTSIRASRFLYDPNRSILSNYAGDIFAGAPIMFFLPRAGAITDRVAVKFLSKIGTTGKSLLVKEAVMTVADVGSQYATLATVDKLYKRFEEVAIESPKDPLLSSQQDDKTILHRLFVVVGFRGVHNLAGHFLVPRAEPLPDYTKDIVLEN